MLEPFFYSNGIFHIEFTPEILTAHRNPLQGGPWTFARFNCRKCPKLWRRRIGCCYTTMPLHIALSFSKRILQGDRSPLCHTLRTRLISHHAIFVSFPAWKHSYSGRSFHSAEEVMTAVREAVRDLPANMFQRCFQQYIPTLSRRAIAANDDYFEEGSGSVKVYAVSRGILWDIQDVVGLFQPLKEWHVFPFHVVYNDPLYFIYHPSYEVNKLLKRTVY